MESNTERSSTEGNDVMSCTSVTCTSVSFCQNNVMLKELSAEFPWPESSKFSNSCLPAHH